MKVAIFYEHIGPYWQTMWRHSKLVSGSSSSLQLHMKASGHRVQQGAARRSVAATAWFLFSTSQTKRAGAEAAA